jgi:hypothetical protein
MVILDRMCAFYQLNKGIEYEFLMSKGRKTLFFDF